MLNDHLEDIALFFNMNGQSKKRWVSKSVYADPNRKLEKFDSTWRKAVLAEGGEANTPYYVTNLSKLRKAPVAPDSTQKKAPPSTPRTKNGGQVAEQGDLVVIPQATPDAAFLVKKSEYQDPTICPDISEIEGADLKFLALTQGAVLANIPKEDIVGMSCFLLNLLGLSSSERP